MAAPPDEFTVVDLDPVFVGRSRSLAALTTAYEERARLVTVVGGPGLGKSRLARHFAASCPSACWVEVEASLDSDELIGRMASAIGSLPAERGAAGLDVLIESLCAQGEMLVVLDGIEASIDAARHVLGALLVRCGDLRALVTSQVALGLTGEHRIELEPLEPEGARALFCARARQTSHDFEVQPDEEAVLQEVLHRLERVPLAIELAAGSLHTLSLSELRRRFEAKASLMSSSRRDGPARHRNMGEAVGWSWSLLTPSLQQALAQLAVFRGPFTLAAAEAVLQLDVPAAPLEIITLLRERSLVRRLGTEGRLQILGEVRRYAEARRGEDDIAVRTRHARWFAGHLERTIDVMYGMPSEIGLDSLELEQSDLQAALEFAAEGDPHAAVACALVLARYYSVRGPGWRALEAIERGLSMVGHLSDEAELRPRLEMGHAIIARAWFGRLEPERLVRAITSFEGRHPALEAEARAHHAYVLIESNRRDEGERSTAAAVAVAEADGHPVSVTICRGLVGLSRFADGRVDEAAREFGRALASGGARTSPRLRARYLACRGQARIEQGKLEAAQSDLQEALRLQDHECQDRLYGPLTVLHLASWALAADRAEDAERFAEEALSRIRRAGVSRGGAEPSYVLGWVHLERGDFDEAQLQFAQGGASTQPVVQRASALGRTALALAEGEPQLALEESDDHTADLGQEGLGHRPMLLALRALAMDKLGQEGGEAARAAARAALVKGGSRRAEAVVELVTGETPDDVPLWPELRLLRRWMKPQAPRWQYDLETDVLSAPDGRRLEGRTRSKLALLLRVLARARAHHRGETVSKEAIIEAVWPGDRGDTRALENRLWVALSSFRKMGFDDLIERLDTGYRFRIDQEFELLGERCDPS